MKNILTYIALILVFVFQSALGRHIEVLHIVPNLMLVFVVCYSMNAEPVKATVLSVAAGIIMDLFAARHLGINALMMMYLGMILSCVTSGYIRTNFVTALVCVAVSTLFYEGIYAFLMYFIFGKLTVGTLFTVAFFEAVYNTVTACALFWLCRYLAYDEVRSF